MKPTLLAGYPVVSAVLTLPQEGRWSATVHLDADEIPTGRVELDLLGTTYQGTVIRGGLVAGDCTVRVMGGADGWLQVLEPKNWVNGVTVGALLRETLGQAGEGLATSSSPSLAGLLLPRWSRPRTVCADECMRIAARAGGVLRQLPDGTWWLGAETWPAVRPAHDLLDVIPVEQRAVISADELDLRPGQVLQEHGWRVLEVEHHVAPGSVVTHLLYEEA